MKKELKGKVISVIGFSYGLKEADYVFWRVSKSNQVQSIKVPKFLKVKKGDKVRIVFE